jgi:FkbM family methyltransferase
MTAYKASLLHTLIESFLRGRKNKVSCLQIGANDGVNADFIRDRALKNDWFCVLVEPHPNYYLKLKENYQSSRRVFFENVAISSDYTVMDLHYVINVNENQYWSTGIASFDKDHLIRHNIPLENIGISKVPCITLSDLVKKYYLYDVDLMVVDVEGHELSVFLSGEFKLFQPKLIIFEHHHLPKGDIDQILSHVGPNYDYCEAEYDAFLIRVRNDSW